jgi:hypothetical protein
LPTCHSHKKMAWMVSKTVCHSCNTLARKEKPSSAFNLTQVWFYLSHLCWYSNQPASILLHFLHFKLLFPHVKRILTNMIRCLWLLFQTSSFLFCHIDQSKSDLLHLIVAGHCSAWQEQDLLCTSSLLAVHWKHTPLSYWVRCCHQLRNQHPEHGAAH